MRFGFAASVLFHLILAGAAFVWGRDWSPDRDYVSEPAIPVELIAEAKISDVTNVPAAVEEPVEEALPEPEVPDDPVPVIEEPIIVAEAPPEPVVPPAPPVKDEPEPEPEPVVEAPTPEPEPEIKKPEPPKPKPVVNKPKPKPQGLDLDALSKLAESAKDAPSEVRKPRETPQGTTTRGGSSGGELTATETALVRAAMQKCWTQLDGAPKPETLIVKVNVRFNRDGTLAGEPKVLNASQIALSGNRFWNVARQNAVRALVECAPYDFLPAARYENWKEITFNFAPGA